LFDNPTGLRRIPQDVQGGEGEKSSSHGNVSTMKINTKKSTKTLVLEIE
jgi:hypothetical protein